MPTGQNPHQKGNTMSNTNTPKTVLLAAETNLGYSADQIDNTMTLADLLEAVEQAIADFGEDATVVLHQVNNRYGANFGRLDSYEALFTDANAAAVCDECGGLLAEDGPDDCTEH